jgi:DNA polymerase-4
VGKVTDQRLKDLGIRRVGDLAGLDERFLEERFGQWGLALAGKARGLDAGAWFDGEVGERGDPKSVSHEHTFAEDTCDAAAIEAMLARLTGMVARRLREHGLYTRTVQIKLRYSDFSTFTRAFTLEHATHLDGEILREVRRLFRTNWTGKSLRLIGVYAQSLERSEGQLRLLDQEQAGRWEKALGAVDRLRDKFGESSVSLGGGLGAGFRERTHENPAGLPGRDKKPLSRDP